MDVETVNKIHEDPKNNILTLLDTGKIDYVISTSAKGRIPAKDTLQIAMKWIDSITKPIHLLNSIGH